MMDDILLDAMISYYGLLNTIAPSAQEVAAPDKNIRL